MTQIGQLRPINEADLDLMLAWRNDPSIRSKMYTRDVIDRDDHLEWWTKTAQREDCAFFMYEDAGTPFGVVSFTQIDRLNSNCSWAFYASPQAPKGTGSRMEYLALEKVFDELKLNRLRCEVLDFNKPVISLHQKFGFQIEGTYREHHLYDGQYVDVVSLGILAPEWAEKRQSIHERLVRLASKK